MEKWSRLHCPLSVRRNDCLGVEKMKRKRNVLWKANKSNAVVVETRDSTTRSGSDASSIACVNFYKREIKQQDGGCSSDGRALA